MIDNKNESICLYILGLLWKMNKIWKKKKQKVFLKISRILEAKNKLEGFAEILQL